MTAIFALIRRIRATKITIGPDVEDRTGKSFTWHLENDAGQVLARSARSFPSKERCELEVENIKKGAASTKVVHRALPEKPASLRAVG